MNENSYLSPADIKNQCDAAIRNLEQNNQATQLTGWNLDLFIGDSQLESEAFATLKQQMEDYKTVLQTIRMANQCDIEDFQFLKMVVGNQELDGNVILEQKDIAMSAKKSDEEKVEKYRKKANSTNSATLRLNYSMKVAHYRVMAEIDQRLYDAWQEKQNMYDGIEGLTARLFERSAAMRATVENALTSIRGAFQNGVYVPDMNASWRSEVYDIYFNSVFTISDNGEFKIDMEEVEKILSKDARDITAAEYDVLAMAYLMADDEDLAVFMQSMLKERTDYNTSWYASSMNYKVYSEWKIDQEKVEQLRKRVKEYAESELKVIKEYGVAGDKDAVAEGEDERGVTLQRMTLLDVINQIGAFGGEYEADYPTISIRKRESGELTIEFYEGWVINGSKPTGSTLRNSEVTISKTVIGEYIKYEQSEYARYILTNYLGGYSLGDEVGKFAVDKAKGMVEIDEQKFKNWSNRVKQIPGKETLGKAIGYIPFIGEAVEFGIDTWMNSKEAERKVEFITEEMNDIDAANLYSDFDCCVNFVDFDLIDKNSHEFYPYAGYETDFKITEFNEEDVLREAFSTELTREMLLKGPEHVLEFLYKAKNDADLDDSLEYILSK